MFASMVSFAANFVGRLRFFEGILEIEQSIGEQNHEIDLFCVIGCRELPRVLHDGFGCVFLRCCERETRFFYALRAEIRVRDQRSSECECACVRGRAMRKVMREWARVELSGRCGGTGRRGRMRGHGGMVAGDAAGGGDSARRLPGRWDSREDGVPDGAGGTEADDFAGAAGTDGAGGGVRPGVRLVPWERSLEDRGDGVGGCGRFEETLIRRGGREVGGLTGRLFGCGSGGVVSAINRLRACASFRDPGTWESRRYRIAPKYLGPQRLVGASD